MKKIAIAILLLANSILSFAQSQGGSGRKQLFDYNWKFNLGDDSLAKLRDFNDNA